MSEARPLQRFVHVDDDGANWVSVIEIAETAGRDAGTLPRSLRIILEAAAHAAVDGRMDATEALALLQWRPGVPCAGEWRFPIGRVLLQDASGIPLLADLAALRDASAEHGQDPELVDLALPATIVVDHAVVTDAWGHAGALAENLAVEFGDNAERYSFLRWAEAAFRKLSVVPPGNGIVHQIHLEQVADVVSRRDGWCLCDTVIGTDSHTTMVNGLGVLGWGVGGIEAETALLGEMTSLPMPEMIGIDLHGAPPAGVLAADIALTLTARLRAEKVVGAFLEFGGAGVAALSVADRATIANMAPEYGATLALFPVDELTLDYLARHGRTEEQVARVRRHLSRQGLFGTGGAIAYDRVLHIDLSTIRAAAAGPVRPDQLRHLPDVPASYRAAFPGGDADPRIVLAAITSCTNTANLRSLVAAGLLARRATEFGLTPPSWVKTVLAPGSRRSVAALEACGLLRPLEQLGFHVSAFGCGPCVGNTGALAPEIEALPPDAPGGAAVLSSNRNFEGRIHSHVRGAYLMNPALVVAYALAGRIDLDLSREPIVGDIRLDDIWPDSATIEAALAQGGPTAPPNVVGAEAWAAIEAPKTPRYPWSRGSTFFVRPPFFRRHVTPTLRRITGARPLLLLGDAITTDHISPVSAIPRAGAAADYLGMAGVTPDRLGSYSGRRVNHEVMVRGTFANPRLDNHLSPGTKGLTRHMPSGRVDPIHVVAARYQDEGVPLVVVAGRDYGSGSARDWAAKGTALLGIRAVLANSFERIHRSNLISLGVLPIMIGTSFDILATGNITIDLEFPRGLEVKASVDVKITADGVTCSCNGELQLFTTTEVRLIEAGDVFQHTLSRLFLEEVPTMA